MADNTGMAPLEQKMAVLVEIFDSDAYITSNKEGGGGLTAIKILLKMK